MRKYFRLGAIALAATALIAGPSGAAVTPAQSRPVIIAMNLPNASLAAQMSTIQPTMATAAQSFETLAEKVAATESDVAAAGSQLRCLATAIYFEARSEPVEGQLAVAQVVRNRARSGRFPASLCGVVYQRSQFSFSRRRAPDNRAQWARAVKIAAIALNNGWREIAKDALYFHAARVSPGWNRQLVARVGNNIFYR